MPATPFCICATCTHSHGFPTSQEMPDTGYRDYQNLLDGECWLNPPVPVAVDQVNSAGPRVTSSLRHVRPVVSPVGRCGQWVA